MGKLRHYGYADTGFSEKGLKDAGDRMKPLFIDKCPFVNPHNIKVVKLRWSAFLLQMVNLILSFLPFVCGPFCNSVVTRQSEFRACRTIFSVS
ncbi:MAG: hypothetical protein JO025_10120 [Verrucomicrobia bacterium]|nr:hypothetical protein [Verrucomicrobiota bacterium]